MQKISRFSEGWEKSLRYRNVAIDSISGLRNICLANNPNLGDEGLRFITEVLKEDAWVKCKCGTLELSQTVDLFYVPSCFARPRHGELWIDRPRC